MDKQAFAKAVALAPAVASAIVLFAGQRLIGQIDALDARMRSNELQIVELRARLSLPPADNGYRWGVLPLVTDEPPKPRLTSSGARDRRAANCCTAACAVESSRCA